MTADISVMWRAPWPRTHIHAAMPSVMSNAMLSAMTSGRAVRPGQTVSQTTPKSAIPTTIETVISR